MVTPETCSSCIVSWCRTLRCLCSSIRLWRSIWKTLSDCRVASKLDFWLKTLHCMTLNWIENWVWTCLKRIGSPVHTKHTQPQLSFYLLHLVDFVLKAFDFFVLAHISFSSGRCEFNCQFRNIVLRNATLKVSSRPQGVFNKRHSSNNASILDAMSTQYERI